MAAFFSTPNGNVFNLDRIGGVKAFEENFLILGTGQDEVLDYAETSPAVAIAWRDATADVLTMHSQRRNRPFRQLDWLKIAFQEDAVWAREWAAANNWDIRGVYENAPSADEPLSGNQPKRRSSPVAQPVADDDESM